MNIHLAPHQQAFALSDARFTALVAGVGSGKSHAGCVRALLAAGGQLGSRRIRTPNLGVITAPTYPMLRDATLRTFLEIAEPAIARYNKSEMLLELTNGSEIIFRSTDAPDRLRGPSVSWWYGDEAALYPPNVWQIMIGRLRQFGMAGRAWITTTPRGRNWVWQRFVQNATTDYHIVRAATHDNPFLDTEFITALEADYVGDFARQELLGEFVAFEGLVYPEFQRERHTFTHPIDLTAYQRIIAGVDWGFNNPGVILLLGVTHDDHLDLIAEHYERRRPLADWVTTAQQLHDLYTIDALYCDPSQPDYIRAFTAAGLPAHKADNTVDLGIQRVRQALITRADGRPRLMIAHSAVHTISEFEQYQWASNPHGLRDQPLKANDHAMDALRYALMGAAAATQSIETTTTRYA